LAIEANASALVLVNERPDPGQPSYVYTMGLAGHSQDDTWRSPIPVFNIDYTCGERLIDGKR
jgi:hypothetical protein